MIISPFTTFLTILSIIFMIKYKFIKFIITDKSLINNYFIIDIVQIIILYISLNVSNCFTEHHSMLLVQQSFIKDAIMLNTLWPSSELSLIKQLQAIHLSNGIKSLKIKLQIILKDHFCCKWISNRKWHL